MNKLRRYLSVILLVVCFFSVSAVPVMASDSNDEITVDIRIEGQTETIWNGEVNYSTSTITDKQGDTYTIDHPTALGALQEAAEEGDFNYVVSSAYGALGYIEEISGESGAGSCGWLYSVNWESAGCAAVDYTLEDGDEVIWYYGGWSAQLLKVSTDTLSFGSEESITVTVETDNATSQDPVEGATLYVGSHIYTTDVDGQVSGISLSPGVYTVYAEKETYENYIRSNSLEIISYVPLELQAGWNFISIPKRLEAENSTVNEIFNDIDTAGHSIFAFDSTNGWQAVSEEDVIYPLEGIWIYSASAVELYPVFDSDPLHVPPTKDLSAGWNAIGFTDFNSATANSALTSVEDQWAYLIGFNAETQSYEVSIVNNAPADDPHSETRSMSTWKGYWLYMTDEAELAAIGF